MFEWAALVKYGGVFFGLIAAGFGFPIPEEIPIVTGGAMVGHDEQEPPQVLRWYIMLPVCIFGVVLADSALYMIGRACGPKFLEREWVRRRVITPPTRERIERNFREYGIGILLVARLLPGIRTPIFIMSGIMRVSPAKFILADGIYAIPGVSLLFFLAYYFTDNFTAAINKLESYRSVVISVLLAAAAGVLIYLFIRRRFATGDPGDVPLFGRQLGERLHPHDENPVDEGGQNGSPPETDGEEPKDDDSSSTDPEGPKGENDNPK